MEDFWSTDNEDCWGKFGWFGALLQDNLGSKTVGCTKLPRLLVVTDLSSTHSF